MHFKVVTKEILSITEKGLKINIPALLTVTMIFRRKIPWRYVIHISIINPSDGTIHPNFRNLKYYHDGYLYRLLVCYVTNGGLELTF